MILEGKHVYISHPLVARVNTISLGRENTQNQDQGIAAVGSDLSRMIHEAKENRLHEKLEAG